MRAANDYLVLKKVQMQMTDAQQRTMTVHTAADEQLEVVSVGINADSDQFEVGQKVVAEVNPSYYFYTGGETFIAVRAKDVKAVL